MARKYGWKPDPKHAPKLGGERLMFASGALPPSASIGNLGEPYDQGQTGTCVANASAKAIEITSGVHASRLGIYSQARIRGGEDMHALSDDGCVIADAVASMTEVGVCSEDRWPFDPSQVNVPAPWDAIRADARVTGWQKLETADEVRAAIAAGHPVIFGMQVDQSYEDSDGSSTYTGPVGPSLGGHCQTIVGYAPGQFLALNSWGKDWAAKGMVWIAESFLFGSGLAADFTALDAAPEVLS